MFEESERAWRFYLEDMIVFAHKVLIYSEGIEQQDFVENELFYDAILRNLELIGEAATHIPDEVRSAYAHIPWRMVIATRNRLIHGYLGLDDDVLWSIVREDVPELLVMLRAIQI